MAEKEKKIKAPMTVMPQITLLLSQFPLLIVQVSGFYYISSASFTAYKRTFSPLHIEGANFSIYD